MSNLSTLLFEIAKLDRNSLYTAHMALQGRRNIIEMQEFITAIDTYLALGSKVVFVVKDGENLYRREGTVIGYTTTRRVKIQYEEPTYESLFPITATVFWREISPKQY